MIQIRYTTEYLSSTRIQSLGSIVLGLFFLLLAYAGFDLKGLPLATVGFAQTILGVVYYVLYLQKSKQQYLSLEGGRLRRNSIFPKSVELSKLKSAQETYEYIKLLSEEGELSIHIKIIDPDSLSLLRKELEIALGTPLHR